MDTKLTLKLDTDVIARAKDYASQRRVSLSRLVENYLDSVTKEKDTKDDFEISLFVKSIASGKSIPSDFDYRQEYTDFLQKKHS